jgi:hypothetical protein
MYVEQQAGEFRIHQKKYVEEIVAKYGGSDATPVKAPLNTDTLDVTTLKLIATTVLISLVGILHCIVRKGAESISETIAVACILRRRI